VGVLRGRRTIVLVAVLALHVLFIAVFVESARERKQPSADAYVVMALIDLPYAAPVSPIARRGPAVTKAPAIAPAVPASVLPQAQVPKQPVRANDFIDWTANAQQAARNVLAAEAAERARNSKMGAGWWLAQDAKQQRRVGHSPFPWSRHPGPAGVEIDPESFVITFRLNRRCQVSVFLILPGFGCALGRLDPEPGRADLFDPRYRSAPIERPSANSDADAGH
jgi:hypothetical protein